LKALKKQDEELESVHKSIEHQQQQINKLAGLVKQKPRTNTVPLNTPERFAIEWRERADHADRL